jgi:predicted O-methyltransferase YrrM
VGVVGSAASPLFLRTLWRGPRAAFEFSARALEVCKELTEQDLIPPVTLAELAPNGAPACEVWLDLGPPSSEMPPADLASLCTVARLFKPRCVVEIGTATGWTTRHLARNTPADCRIFTVDLPNEGMTDPAQYSDPHLVEAASKTRRDFADEPKITQILHDSTTLEWDRHLDRPVDIALVDGSHLYEHVRADTERLWRVLAPGAVVLWHDYATVEVRRGVRRFLLELYRAGCPVRRLAGTRFGVYVDSAPRSHTESAQPFVEADRADQVKGAPCWS